MKHLLSLFVINRLWIFLLALFAIQAASSLSIPIHGGDKYPYYLFQGDHTYTYKEPANRALDMWVVWDTKFYISIAEDGYSTQPVPFTRIDNKGFLPIYPFLLWLFSTFLFFGNIHLAGVVMSNLFLILSLHFLFKLVVKEPKFNTTIYADKTYIWWYVLLFPTSYYLSTIYPESLFLLLSVLVFYLVQKKQFLGSILVFSLACLTKVFGIFLLIPIIIGIWLDRKEINLLKLLTYGVIGSFFPCIYMYYMYTISGDPFAYLHIQNQFFRHEWQNPIVTLIEAFNNKGLASVWNISFILFGLSIICIGIKKLPPAYYLYAICYILFTPITGTLDGTSRYLASLFVLPVALTVLIKNQHIRLIILLVFATIQGFGILWWTIGAGFAS